MVTSCGEITTINSKKGGVLEKRSIVLIDQSSFSIELTLWGKQAMNLGWNPDQRPHPVISIRGVKVSDFNSKILILNRMFFYF